MFLRLENSENYTVVHEQSGKDQRTKKHVLSGSNLWRFLLDLQCGDHSKHSHRLKPQPKVARGTWFAYLDKVPRNLKL